MIKIGVISPSEIALKRFMPSLKQLSDVRFVGVGICNADEREYVKDDSSEYIQKKMDAQRGKAKKLVEIYGGKIFEGYGQIATSDEIDALYISLPPALHYKWAKKALNAGKHVMLEKPFTTSLYDTKELVQIAQRKKLALHENYMFLFHNQIYEINKLLELGEIGDVRLYRIAFGFPKRSNDDFRYNKDLGGGALLDAGGYTIQYAARMLKNHVTIDYARLNYIKGYGVDLYGSGSMSNSDGTTAQISFGMDNSYKCELEVWGSKGALSTGRVFTAPTGYSSELMIQKGDSYEVRKLPADDAFKKSITHFINCMTDDKIRIQNYNHIVMQSSLVEDFRYKATIKI